jgi:hypothetical protein
MDTAFLVNREAKFHGVATTCDVAELTRLVLEREQDKKRRHNEKFGGF